MSPNVQLNANSENETVFWGRSTLKTYARAYELSKDKSKRQKRAVFLEKGHSLGIVNNLDYKKPLKIGENR